MHRSIVMVCFSIYFVIQLMLPLRHWVIQDDVLWTEEGHRMSWRMMLRTKAGSHRFIAVDKSSGEKEVVKQTKYLTAKQIRSVGTKPDFIWQFAQYIKQDYAKNGKDVSVYATGSISVNGRPLRELVNDTIDLASVPWSHFKHSDWLLSSEDYIKN